MLIGSHLDDILHSDNISSGNTCIIFSYELWLSLDEEHQHSRTNSIIDDNKKENKVCSCSQFNKFFIKQNFF